MGAAGYMVGTIASGAVALAAGTATAVVGVNATANFGCVLKKYRIGFNGVTASAVPAYVEICNCTFATIPPGTSSTTETVWQTYGKGITAGFAGASAWTVIPTVISPLDAFMLTPNGGTVIYDYPLGDCPDLGASTGFLIRVTAPAIVSCRAALLFERA